VLVTLSKSCIKSNQFYPGEQQHGACRLEKANIARALSVRGELVNKRFCGKFGLPGSSSCQERKSE
ncbi:hypothetical protein CRM22_002211, partial [Opisthorchis felineus]